MFVALILTTLLGLAVTLPTRVQQPRSQSYDPQPGYPPVCPDGLVYHEAIKSCAYDQSTPGYEPTPGYAPRVQPRSQSYDPQPGYPPICPDGLVYHEAIKSCAYDQSTPGYEPTPGYAPRRSYGQYADPCKEFYNVCDGGEDNNAGHDGETSYAECVKGYGYQKLSCEVKQCPDGLVYHESVKSCNYDQSTPGYQGSASRAHPAGYGRYQDPCNEFNNVCEGGEGFNAGHDGETTYAECVQAYGYQKLACEVKQCPEGLVYHESVKSCNYDQSTPGYQPAASYQSRARPAGYGRYQDPCNEFNNVCEGGEGFNAGHDGETSYAECVAAGYGYDKNLRCEVKECAEGLVYHESVKSCNYDQSTPGYQPAAGYRRYQGPCDEFNNVCEGGEGFNAGNDGETSFAECVAAYGYQKLTCEVKQCPEGLVYHESVKSCNYDQSTPDYPHRTPAYEPTTTYPPPVKASRAKPSGYEQDPCDQFPKVCDSGKGSTAGNYGATSYARCQGRHGKLRCHVRRCADGLVFNDRNGACH